MPRDSDGTRPQKARWIDLSRFGAALKIQPKSAVRPALAVLEVRDWNALAQRHRLAAGEASPTDTAGAMRDAQEARQRLEDALAVLGFNRNPRTLPYDDLTKQHPLQYQSFQTRFTILELEPLFPGLSATDMTEMPLWDFVVKAPTITDLPAWEAYIQQMAEQAAPVWVPRKEPLSQVYGEGRPLPMVDPANDPTVIPPAWLGRTRVAPYRATRLLGAAEYRENALATCYPDEATAIADGWGVDELEVQTLPYALPLWVYRSGRVLAFRDIRLAPEIMDVPPDVALGPLPGKLFEAMRQLPSIRSTLDAQWRLWSTWAEDPGALGDPAEMTTSLQAIVDAVARLKPYGVYTTLRGLVDMPPAGLDEREPAVARSPIAIEAEAMGHLASCFHRFGVGGDASLSSLAGALSRALDSARARVQDSARAKARADLDALADHALGGQDEGRLHHEDVGEHIGGARKDFARRAMVIEDLASLNTSERNALVVKKNVWPPLDYAAMRERGVSAYAAWAIKMLKDALNVTPDRRDDESEAQYIEAISYVRDALNPVCSIDDVRQVIRQIYVHGATVGTGAPLDGRSLPIAGNGRFQIQWGRDFSNLVFEGGRYDDPCIPRKIVSAMRLRVGENPENWSAMIKPKRVKNPDRSEADKAKAETDRELHRPHLEHVQRDGNDWRQGRDVIGDDLMTHFGFRAVEWGNWLPQDERQDVLNMAFDSFADLAQALEIPPQAISLEGSLAIAFGSRGHGGRHAALAHYESERVVINLTRMKGAGALAHEWMHAWDYHMGKGRSAVDSAAANTALGDLVLAMHQQPADPDALHEKSWEGARRGKDNANSWLYLQPADERPRLKEVNEHLFERAYQRIESTIASRIHDFCRSTVLSASACSGALPLGDASDISERILDQLKKACPSKTGFTKVRDKIESNVAFYVARLSIACTIEAARQAHLELPPAFLGFSNSEISSFHAHARKLDTLRAKPYWATRRELFARAGAAFVHDRLVARGVRNDYLVYGAEADRYADHPIGNPNPSGVEREVLDNLYLTVLDDYRLRLATHPELLPG